MVLFFLCIKAETENIGTIELRKDANLRISVMNPQSGHEVRENVVVNPSETVEQEESSREPPYHFGLKWEGSKKPSILRVLTDEETASALKKKKYKGDKPRAFTGEDSGKWVPLLCMECRGLEPYAFSPMKDEFVISSEGGCVFDEDIELGEKEWAEYDADNDVPVSLEEIEFQFQSV
eukprot:Nitzschia sp. Nitz4//scaffold134_size62860//46617//47150//NITZ4_006333-RA/size62860-processed-gene-0.45-mRNA-1//-1//CDS//3329535511//1232//frame0